MGASICLAVALVLLAAFALRPRREGFVSRRAVRLAAQANAAFAGGRPRYREYRRRVAGADPVQFDGAVRIIAQKGALTPHDAQTLLG